MESISVEAWAGLLGALGGAVVGGLISWGLQAQSAKRQRNEAAAEKKERRQGMANAILYKLMAIASHYAIYVRTFEEAWARADGEHEEPWQFVLASAHEPDPIHFTTDEMSLLVHLGMQDVFNSLLTLADAHNQMGALAKLYAAKRDELMRMLPPNAVVQDRAELMADRPLALQTRRLMIELNGLANTMRDFARRDAAESLETLEKAHAEFTAKLALRWRLERPEGQAPEAAERQ